MKRTSILLAFLIMYIIGYSQTINYLYDSSGNRTYRTISLKSTRNADNKVDEEQNQQPFSDQLGDIEITIYPNPSKGELTIDIENLPEDPVGWIGVYDISGKLVFKQTELVNRNIVNISSSDNITTPYF
jgi:hypothetical protein